MASSIYDRFFKWYGYAQSRLTRICGVGSGGVVDVSERFLSESEEAARDRIQ